jgi:hypothetical protein
LNALRSSLLTKDKLAEDLAKKKKLTIRTTHPLSEKLPNLWSAEDASHTTLFFRKRDGEMIG